MPSDDTQTSKDADDNIRAAAKGRLDDTLAAKDFDAAIRKATGHGKDDDE